MTAAPAPIPADPKRQADLDRLVVLTRLMNSLPRSPEASRAADEAIDIHNRITREDRDRAEAESERREDTHLHPAIPPRAR